MSLAPYRIAYVVSHPIQYQAPLLRALCSDPGLAIHAFFLSDLSVRGYRDREFARDVRWDVPLLDGYPSTVLPAWGSHDRLTFWRPLTRGLAAALDRRRFDAVWVHGYAHQALLRTVASARRQGLPVLLRGESHLTSHPRGSLRRLAKEALLRPLFAQVDGFLAIGRRNRAYYRHYGVPEARLHDMPYAVDNAWFQARVAAAAPDRAALRARLGLAADRPVVLFASKLIERKRPQDLLGAFRRCARLPDRHPYLLFVGDGPLRPELERLAAGDEAVRLLGFANQSELPALYDLCDVFVLPSEHEPWGLVVNEVMNAARPVIVSDQVGAAADLVEDGVEGFVIAKGDVEALGRRLAELVSDPDRAARMGRAALERVSHYNFESDRRGLRAALRAVLPNHPRSRAEA